MFKIFDTQKMFVSKKFKKKIFKKFQKKSEITNCTELNA